MDGSLQPDVPGGAAPEGPDRGPLSQSRPVAVAPVTDASQKALLAHLLARYHYLGFHRTVGENLKYLVSDPAGRPLACLLFGAPAWQSAPRDRCIDWTSAARAANLPLVTNNTRFLVLPRVRIPLLASHVLGQVVRRLAADWQVKYGHPICLPRDLRGQHPLFGDLLPGGQLDPGGETTGRSRNDRQRTFRLPARDIYLYPLRRDFQEVLRG